MAGDLPVYFVLNTKNKMNDININLNHKWSKEILRSTVYCINVHTMLLLKHFDLHYTVFYNLPL